MALGLLAGRRLVGCQVSVQSRSGIRYRSLQRLFQLHVAFLSPGLAYCVKRRIGKDLVQPLDQLRLGGAPKLIDVFMGLEEGILDQVRRVETPAETRIQLQLPDLQVQ